MVTVLGVSAFLGISLLFLIFRSTPILFHTGCLIVISLFVHVSGRSLHPDNLEEWIILTTGLVLYWFGLVIVRIMLTRSVSLRMLSSYETDSHSVAVAEEGIAARLRDVSHFGLMRQNDDGYRLTLFGRLIAEIVAFSYAVLRIR